MSSSEKLHRVERSVGAWLDGRPVHGAVHVGDSVVNLRISLLEEQEDDDDAVHDEFRYSV
jgi:hypothetical protein